MFPCLHYGTWQVSDREVNLDYQGGPNIVTWRLKRRVPSPAGGRREVRERQRVRRIQGTIAGLKMEGATWQRMWMTSRSWEQLLANENGNFSPTPQITGLYHQPEWPCKQVFPPKSSQPNTLIAAMWFPEYRTKLSPPHFWSRRLINRSFKALSMCHWLFSHRQLIQIPDSEDVTLWTRHRVGMALTPGPHLQQLSEPS